MQNQVLKEKVDKYFKDEEKNNKILFQKLALYIYQVNSVDSDLFVLANILSENELIKLISYFDGDTIKIPSKEEHKECLFLAVCFYLKEIKGLSWEEIKGFINIPAHSENLNTINLGRKISEIKNNMNQYFNQVVESINWTEEEIQIFFEGQVKNYE